jgi:hypothetical protein
MEYWRQHFATLAAKGLAPIQTNQPRNNALFKDITIDGCRFVGVVTEWGPFVGRKSALAGRCALGVASINYCPDLGPHRKHASWHICKYHSQWHVDLDGLSEKGRHTLAVEFGLPLVPLDPATVIVPTEWAFYVSPAFQALSDWANNHPRLIKKAEPNDYLWNWPRAALSGDPADAVVF